MATPDQGNPASSPDSGHEKDPNRSPESNQNISRPGRKTPRGISHVRFTPGGESVDSLNQKATFDIRDHDSAPLRSSLHSKSSPALNTKPGHGSPHKESSRHQTRSPQTKQVNTEPPTGAGSKSRIEPALGSRSGGSDEEEALKRRETGSHGSAPDETASQDPDNLNEKEEDKDEGDVVGKLFSEKSAFERAQRLSRVVGTQSEPATRRTSPNRSPARSPPPSPPPEQAQNLPIDLSDIPLEKLETKRTKYGIEDDSEDEVENNAKSRSKVRSKVLKSAKRLAKRPVGWSPKLFNVHDITPPLQSGQTTPIAERDPEHYVPRPKQYREGYLSSLMKLYDQQGVGAAFANLPRGHDAVQNAYNRKDAAKRGSVASFSSDQGHSPAHSPESRETTPNASPAGSPEASGTTTPRGKHEKWYYKNKANMSTGSIADLIGSSTVLATPARANEQSTVMKPKPKHKPRSSHALDAILGKKRLSPRAEDSITLQIHIAETIQRQKYIMKMCRALMIYGAPTHRLEEYMRMSARVLEIDGQFLYMPGCMIISFDDPGSHTTEVKIVRATQAVNLGKLRDTHEIYKEVVHDKIGVEEATQRLDEIIARKNRYGSWFLVSIYGLASASVGPFAFQARPIDLPIAFFLGCLLGFMQLILAPRSDLYSNVFEITAAVLTSFLARAFGSIKQGNLFCFSALAQSAIALILPGYTVLCGSLELQSRSIVPGSVRMVYAIIYSLFLGFGITIGSSLYGWADKHATSATTCGPSWPIWWQIIFVPLFTLCLIIINHGKVKQMPIMIFIAVVGWVVNHYSAERFSSNAQIANTLGALSIGVLGNLYSRLRHGLAAAALLPAIFVQVPSGLAASGSLVSGVISANQIVNKDSNGSGITTVSNGTQAGAGGVDINSAVLNVGYSMIQVAIGITVGLFLSALVVYPFGKRRSGLFSF